MQINLTGFLNGKGARIFMGELWAMLDSAQKSENGIPEELLTAKMEELKDKKSEEVKLKVTMMMRICYVSLVLRKHFLAKKTWCYTLLFPQYTADTMIMIIMIMMIIV